MTTTETYDAIVIGVGGMGSAACYHLANRGKRVLGLERYDIPHAMGSSHGVNRIIRLAYYENPAYVPLLRRAYELWRDLETGLGEQVLHITGSIDASEPDGEVFTGSLQSCELHDLPYEVFTGKQLRERFPGYRLPDTHQALLQPEGGFVRSDRAIVGHALGAMAAGARIKARERALEWEYTNAGVRVRTDKGTYEAERLIVSAGAWIGDLLPQLAGVSVPERQVLAWLQPTSPEKFRPDVFPVFNVTVEEGRYYGFPMHGIPGFKIGRYHHRQELIDPESWNREPEPEDERILREFTARYFPEANGDLLTMASCIFTNTADEHFVIDFAGDERVIAASPCSGHGFKFCSVVGEILADMATRGATDHEISLFQLGRFSAPAA